MKRWDETAFHKMCNVTDLPLVIGNDVMRLPFTNVPCHSLAAGHRKKWDETAFSQNVQCLHSLAVGHRKR
jgi:hypothetical protein